MKVKIIHGTYGHRPDKDEMRVVRKDSSSAPFELDDKEAKRLIGLGVAEVCNETGSLEESQDDTDKVNISEQIMGMEYIEMKKLAKEWGISSKGTKEELRTRLLQANEDNAPEDDAISKQNVNDDTSQNADNGQNSQNAEDNADQDDADNADNDAPPVLQPQEPQAVM